MQNTRVSIIIITLVASLIWGCSQRRNFYEDGNDPGLSRLTSRGYTIATFYLNDTPYINPYFRGSYFGSGNSNIDLQKIETASDKDTVVLSWRIENNAIANQTGQLSTLAISIPVEKNFTKFNLHSWEGIFFPADSIDRVTIVINRDGVRDSGFASIYFVKVGPAENSADKNDYYFTGLFEGSTSAGAITKGRFDFRFNLSSLYF